MSITTPLGTDVLLLRNFTFSERLGIPFVIRADLQSTDADIDFDSIIGKNVTIQVNLPTYNLRYFNGIVSTFRQVGFSGNLTNYRATIVPWLWMLTRTSDCRIFQNKTIPEILSKVFSKVPSSKVQPHLTADYPPVPFCVQYNETAFNFVSRLMEQSGIFYYFDHTETENIMVLCDGDSVQPEFPGYETIPYNPDSATRNTATCIYDWVITHRVETERFSMSDYDFMQPKARLFETASASDGTEHAHLDAFYFPGLYRTHDEGEDQVKVRIEERQVREEIQQGKSNALGLAAGYKFRFSGYRRRDQNVEMRTTALEMRLTSASFAAGELVFVDEGFACTCEFTTLTSDRIFRSAQRAVKPLITGPQPATVVASKDATETDYDADAMGSVLVRFHWDHDPSNDSEASCRIRVQQNSADTSGSSMFIPQVGSEVIVTFQYGDPDRPIITGRVFNADILPPISPKTSPYVSYIENASNENFLSMDATAGAQKVVLQNVKNQITMDSTKGSESLTITDGTSKIVFDPTAGSVTTTTPGDQNNTNQSDSHSWTWGDWNGWVFGIAAETVFGSSFNSYIGNYTQITVATLVGLTIGGKFEISAPFAFEYSRGWKVSKGGMTDLHTTPSIVQVSDAILVTANVSRTTVVGGTDTLTVTGARTQTFGDLTGTYASVTENVAADSNETVVGMKNITGGEVFIKSVFGPSLFLDADLMLSSPTILIQGEMVNIG